MPSRIPEAISEPKALLNKIPHERIAVRKPSSLRLYHFESRNKAPYCSLRTRAKHSRVVTYWDERTLANTQEETRQESTDKIVGNTGQGRGETPKGHGNWKVYGRFPNMIEEHVPVSLWGQKKRSNLDQGESYEGTCMVMYPTWRILRMVAN